MNQFVIDGLKELEHVSIQENSFTLFNQDKDESTNGFFILNCPLLKKIEINGECFEEYVVFELAKLPSLQSIHIGENCFKYVRSFKLHSKTE